MKKTKKYMCFICLLASVSWLQACTIFSAKDKNGIVWAGNNEDNLFFFKNYINIVVATDSTLGYVGFSNDSPDGYMQGAVNEAGLFYDGNAVPATVYKDYDKKKSFPGGPNAMIKYALSRCKTVPEVFKLFKEYRQDGLEGGQLHFADKFGNLGIIVADSMWLTQGNYQVSTNYNLCHANKDNQVCWRFPIAERILKSKEASYETFREICDSTSQKGRGATIYSNIHNLSTGEMWLFYARNFEKPFKTTIKELLKRGNSSFLMYELFLEEPVVVVYKTYQAKGIEAALKKLNEFSLTTERRNELRKFLASDLIICNHDFNAYPFLENFLQLEKKHDELFLTVKAIALFCIEQKEEAKKILENYLKENLKPEVAQDVLSQMQGVFDKKANVKFELQGYETAHWVIVSGLDRFSILNFLIKKDGKWIGEFNLSPDTYDYEFWVDGKKVLDPNNRVKENGLELNRISVKK